MKRCIIHQLLVSVGLLLLTCSLFAQAPQRKINTSRITAPVIIDGKLTESMWENADIASDFTQNSPYPGEKSIRQTEVKILYDNTAIYVGAIMYDNPDSIFKQLTARDEFGDANTDAFVVTFDTYSDKQNGFVFGVTAAGVQADAKMKFDGSDYSWNAAWFSKVAINEDGWCVEMKIPYSALRFPKTKEQIWGVNFYRSIRRVREHSYWSKVLPNVPNFLSQAGTLRGIENIKSPLRLTFLPYVSSYAENYDGKTTNSLNGGLDLKYGINESFTLDLTLVPDFGQTLYDNKVLNLSPIEVRYDERRYFFTEGTDLFNKNDLFYSRRVGGTPVNYNLTSSNTDGNYNSAVDSITQNPLTTKLINATKISGRTKHNMGIGFFNAVSQPAYAHVYNKATGETRNIETSPLTNYNVIVLDQALKNNSYISFINTNVYRQQNSYNADVSALLFKFANKANSYNVQGSGDVSQRFKSSPEVGFRYYLQGGKTKGNYTWYVNTTSISDNFNPNDLGYLDRNNVTYYNFSNNYNTYKPFWKIINTYNHVGVGYNRVFNPGVFQSAAVYGSHNATFTNFLTVGFYWEILPVPLNDYYEPRTPGRFYVVPQNTLLGGFYSTDYRKKFAFDIEFNNRKFNEPGRRVTGINLSPRYRFGDKFSMVFATNFSTSRNNVGFVGRENDSIYLGTRNVNTLTNTLNATYIFTNKMSLKFDARHYWSLAKYAKYSLLDADGSLQESNYNTNHNVNFNSFNIYTSYIWQFKPGSEISIVYQNSIYTRGTNISDTYITNLNNTFMAPQSNSLSIKIIYYLDYLTLKNGLVKSH